MSYAVRYSQSLFTTAALSLAALTLFSCGGASSGGEEQGACNPSNLSFSPMDDGVYFRWAPNCDSKTATNGYSFLIAPALGAKKDFPAGVTAHNHIPYPGDTNPDNTVETAEIKELKNGVEYLGCVVTLFPDGTQSKPSNVVRFTAMPSGEISLNVRYKGDHDGFAFSTGEFVNADASANDLYFLSKSDGDYLASPDKLSFGLRENRFSACGSTRSADLVFTKDCNPGSGSDEIKIKQGDVIVVAVEGGGEARLFVKGFAGSGAERTVTLTWFYNAKQSAS